MNFQFINIYGNYLYFVNQYDEGRLYRTNLSTAQSECLSSSGDTAYVNVLEDTIFFVDVPAGYRITRMDLDGRNRKQLCELRASRLCAYDGLLYFANWDGSDTGLWSMDYNGNCKTHIFCGDIPLFINVNEDGIFWISNNDKCICKTSFGGSTTYYRAIQNITALNMSDGYAYFVWEGPSGYGIYRSADFKTASVVYIAGSNEKTIDCLSVCDGRIIYRAGGGKKSNKTDGSLKSFTFHGSGTIAVVTPEPTDHSGGGSGAYCSHCNSTGRCYKCSGTGRCYRCSGMGHTSCTYCGGGGRCKYCSGTGRRYGHDCSICYGDGQCNFCYGRGTRDCSSCNGSGNCFLCNGSGRCPYCQ